MTKQLFTKAHEQVNPDLRLTNLPSSLLSEEEMQLLEAGFNPADLRNERTSTANFLLLSKDRDRVSIVDNTYQACHQRFGYDLGRNFLGIFNYWGREDRFGVVKEDLDAFKDYIFNKSPISHFLVHTSDEIKEKGFLMPALLPKVLAHFFNIIGRTSTEEFPSLTRFNKYLKAGVNPDIAMAIIKMTHQGYNHQVYNSAGAHRNPFGICNKQEMINFALRQVVNTNKLGEISKEIENCRKRQNYSGTYNLFGTGYTSTAPTHIIEEMNKDLKLLKRDEEKKEVVDAGPPNPFTRVPPTATLGGTVFKGTEDEFIQLLLIYSKEVEDALAANP